MDSKKKTKRIYHVEIDIVDDTEKFAEETGNKSSVLDFVPDHVMLLIIKKAIKRFGDITTPGIYMTDSEIRFPIPNEEVTEGKDKERYIELIQLFSLCSTQSEFNEIKKEIEEIENNYDKETLSDWIDEEGIT